MPVLVTSLCVAAPSLRFPRSQNRNLGTLRDRHSEEVLGEFAPFCARERLFCDI